MEQLTYKVEKMNVDIDKMADYIGRCFDEGYRGVNDKESVIKSIIDEIGNNEPAVDESASRIYTIEELVEMPEGAKFIHSKFGEGRIIVKHGEKIMLFNSPLLDVASFNNNGHPWDAPMQRVE